MQGPKVVLLLAHLKNNKVIFLNRDVSGLMNASH